MPDQFLTFREAKQRFALSHYALTRVIQRGEVPTYVNPLDGRVRLVKAVDLEQISQPRLAPVSRESVATMR